LPLAAPFSAHIFPSYYCNFRCEYCVQCLDSEQQRQIGFEKQQMPLDIFQKAVDDLGAFPARPEAMIFAGHGEPLTHPRIDEMIGCAKRRNAAKRVEIVTNGSLLTLELSDRLIQAGLDRLRVSLQGLSAEDYERVCAVKLDFGDFLSNLAYFYRNKQHTDVFIKIMDIALRKPEDAAGFHEVFDPLCHTAAVEYLFPFIEQIDHSAMGGSLSHTKHGEGQARHVHICAMPFYMLVVLPNGDVTGCCSIEPPVIYGNVKEANLFQMWNGETRGRFLRMLIRSRSENPVCAKCAVPDYGMQQGDYLDEYRERLFKLY
jgi:radical SAM protein with 4Fe4S-binding SPASM domain